MKEITWEQLAISSTNYIHVDNNGTVYYKTYCGKTHRTYILIKDREYSKIKICKKCSIIYRRKYGHSLEGFIARLKVRGKLFIDN